MIGTKKWYESKTIWASIVTVAAAVAGMFGYTIDTDTQNAIISNITSLVAAVGGVIAMWGRIVADKKIG